MEICYTHSSLWPVKTFHLFRAKGDMTAIAMFRRHKTELLSSHPPSMPSKYRAVMFHPNCLSRIRHIELVIKFVGVYWEGTFCEYAAEQREQIIYLLQSLVCLPDIDLQTSRKTLKLIHQPHRIEYSSCPTILQELSVYKNRKTKLLNLLNGQIRAVTNIDHG
ncbi:hypothetical protein MMC31_007752, partial [Peltigera leucophlebia]|nr:hypothetical protein [Peltigera leucophlebia]